MKNMKYIRTDKNGTEIYHDYTCPRCGGAGGADAWKATGWTCYNCGGSGLTDKPSVYKKYTDEYRAILDARAAKRREKKMAQAQAEKAGKQAEWKQQKGFVDDRIHLVGISDSFEKKDEIKAAGGRYNEYTGWYFSEPHEEFQTVEMTAEECLVETVWGNLDWKSTIRETLEAKLPKKPASEHIGSVGEKIDLYLDYIRARYYDTQFGTTWVHTFKDAAGNILVWKTSSACLELENGNRVRVKGTIKAHDEYNGVKQTILTRCKIA